MSLSTQYPSHKDYILAEMNEIRSQIEHLIKNDIHLIKDTKIVWKKDETITDIKSKSEKINMRRQLDKLQEKLQEMESILSNYINNEKNESVHITEYEPRRTKSLFFDTPRDSINIFEPTKYTSAGHNENNLILIIK